MAPGHDRRGRGSLLQSARAAQVPEVGRRRDHAGVADGDRSWRWRYPEVGFTLMSGPRHAASLHADRGPRGAVLPALRRAARPGGRCAKTQAACVIRGYVAALADQGPTRGAQQFFVNRRIVQGPDDRPRRDRRLRGRHGPRAQPRGAPVHRDGARRGGRQRPPDQGRGAVPPPVARARGRPACRPGRHRRRWSPATPAGAACRDRARRRQPRVAEPAGGLAPDLGLELAGAGGAGGHARVQPPPLAGAPGQSAAAPGALPAGSLAEIA